MKIIILFILTLNTLYSSEYLGYLSPGFALGINSSGQVYIDGKISIGMMQHWDIDKFHSASFTLGFNSLLSNKAKTDLGNEYNYFLVQYGGSLFQQNFLLSGIGIGKIFNVKKKYYGSKLIRIYTGAIVFPEIDFLFLEKDKINKNYGVHGVFPIPIYSTEHLGFSL